MVINGVVFAASGPANAPAALYALNGVTGATLWPERHDARLPAVGPESMGRLRSRVRRNAGRHGLRVRVCNGTTLTT
jgi:hypothetical protein